MAAMCAGVLLAIIGLPQAGTRILRLEVHIVAKPLIVNFEIYSSHPHI